MVSPIVVAALVAVASLPSAQAITPNCFFNVSFYDNSPLLHYNPPSAWYSQFVNTPAAQWQPGKMGAGASSHGAFGPGPNVTHEYIGTIAWAQGGHSNATATPIDFQIDGTQQPAAELDQIIWTSTSNQDIQMGTHTAVIQLTKAATDPNAIIMLTLWQNLCGVVAQSSNPDEVQCHEIEFAKDLGSKRFILQGDNWKPYQTFGGQYGQPEIDYSSIIANGTSEINLYPPKGSNYFSLNGTVGNAYGQYTVTFDPAPPYPRQINTFNASNSWEVPGELLYYTPLDPEIDYTVTVTGDADASKYLGLHGFTYCDYALSTSSVSGNIAGQTATGTPTPVPAPKKSSNAGAIAGGVVGGVAGAALIAGLLFFFCRRKRTKKNDLDADPAMFTIDDTIDATTPYHPPPEGGIAKLAQDQNRYAGGYSAGPQYGQQLYQEPNMAEVPYGSNATAGPLLTPDSQSRQGSGPFGDRQSSGNWGSEGSYPHSGMDHRQSLGAASGYMSMSSGTTNEKSIPAHQMRHQSRVEVEQDAGGLPMPAEDVEKLPPTYNPHWLDARTSGAGPSAGPSDGPGPSSSSEMPPGAAPAATAMLTGDNKGQVTPAAPATDPHHPYDPSAQGGAPFIPPKEK